MRLTIVKDDDLVIIDQRSITVDLSQYSLPDNFHALQWYGDQGEEEFSDGTLNARITEISRYQPIINEYRRLAEIEDNPPPPSENERYANLVSKRNSYLIQTDWLMIRHRDQAFHPDITPSIHHQDYLDLIQWRQVLRELPTTCKTVDAWIWPDPPSFLLPKYLSSYPGIVPK